MSAIIRLLRQSGAAILFIGLASLSGVAVAELLDDPLYAPQLVFNARGALFYDPIDDELRINATPLALRLAPGSPPITVGPASSKHRIGIGAEIDADGRLAGGIAGPDLIIVGEVLVAPGDLRSGVLLSGEVSAIGWQDSGGPTDFFDFRFVIDGGLLAPEFGGAGTLVGVYVASEGSNFEGDFTQEEGFRGKAKGTLGALQPAQRTTTLIDLLRGLPGGPPD